MAHQGKAAVRPDASISIGPCSIRQRGPDKELEDLWQE